MASDLRYTAYAFVAVIVLGGLGVLLFGVFGIQAAFTDTTVDEGGPVFASEAGDGSGGTADRTATTSPGTDGSDGVAAAGGGEVQTLVAGDFTGRDGHEVTGRALVLSDGTDQRFLRLEEFESTNGPDLNVYLRAADGEFIDLGDLKGNIGDQNYEIPTTVDLERFDTVQIWCVRFNVLFGDTGLA